MTDAFDPLAHLYELEDDLEPEGIQRTTSLEELTETGPGDDELSAHDLAELVLLVEQKLAAGTLTDRDSAELGLGELGPDGSLDLNSTGRAVFLELLRNRPDLAHLAPRKDQHR